MAKVDVKCYFCNQTEPVKKHGGGKDAAGTRRANEALARLLLQRVPAWNESADC